MKSFVRKSVSCVILGSVLPASSVFAEKKFSKDAQKGRGLLFDALKKEKIKDCCRTFEDIERDVIALRGFSYINRVYAGWGGSFIKDEKMLQDTTAVYKELCCEKDESDYKKKLGAFFLPVKAIIFFALLGIAINVATIILIWRGLKWLYSKATKS